MKFSSPFNYLSNSSLRPSTNLKDSFLSSWSLLTTALPTITPSQYPFNSLTASLEDIPKPRHIGTSVLDFTVFKYSVKSALKLVLSPVVPVEDTQ